MVHVRGKKLKEDVLFLLEKVKEKEIGSSLILFSGFPLPDFIDEDWHRFCNGEGVGDPKSI